MPKEYIDREVAIQAVEKTLWQYQQSVIELRKAPSADVAPVRHARWVPYHDSDFGWDEYGYKCSACDYRVERDKFTFAENFCPLCGAKMDLEG